MKKGEKSLRNIDMAKAYRMAAGSCRLFDTPRHIETNRLRAENADNLANLIAQTRPYEHEIAFAWCNSKDIHIGARLNTNNRGIGICMMAIWSVEQDCRISRDPIAHAHWLYTKRPICVFVRSKSHSGISPQERACRLLQVQGKSYRLGAVSVTLNERKLKRSG